MGVLRPLSLPPFGDGGGWAFGCDRQQGKGLGGNKGNWGQKCSVKVSISIKLEGEAGINTMMQVT